MTLPAWFPELKDVVLFALSLWGAVLSTIMWRKNASRDRRSVSVEASTGFAGYDNGMTGPSLIVVEATNIGHRDVTITTLALDLPEGKRLLAMARNVVPGYADTPLPTTLKDGQRARLVYLFSDVGQAIRGQGLEKTTLQAVCVDSTGGIHRGKKMPVSASDLLK